VIEMKKFLVFAICLLTLTFFNIASAEMRLVTTDDNGYKTYFDTDSLETENDGEILAVRVVGKDPEGWTLLDEVFKYKIDEDGNAYALTNKSGWRLIQTKADAVILDAVLEYMQEVEANEK